MTIYTYGTLLFLSYVGTSGTSVDSVIVSIINVMYITAFAVLRTYAICGQNWRLLLLIIPLVLLQPVTVLVSFQAQVQRVDLMRRMNRWTT